MNLSQKPVISVVGAGLAGSECALQLAELGYSVVLYEMRGIKQTPALQIFQSYGQEFA